MHLGYVYKQPPAHKPIELNGNRRQLNSHYSKLWRNLTDCGKMRAHSSQQQITVSVHKRCLNLHTTKTLCQTPVSRRGAYIVDQSVEHNDDSSGSYVFSSFFFPVKTTPKVKATSRTMKKPVTPQKPEAMVIRGTTSFRQALGDNHHAEQAALCCFALSL